MMLILNDERVEYSKGKVLDLELMVSRIGSVFSPLKMRPRKMSPCRQHSWRKSAKTSTKARKGGTGAARSKIQIQGPTVQNLSQIRTSLDLL